MDEPSLRGPAGNDDDRTVIRARRSATAVAGHVLPAGTRLLDYEITGLIGEGGFGIVYLAWDHSLQRQVAVKEYMPASMASRAAGSSAIVVKSGRHLDTFRAGLKSFVNEARLLARFDHPALVKVYRFWEENGTAYMVMPFYEGPTLKVALAALGREPDEDEVRRWLMPLLDALAVLHAAHCFHRDVAPDNILLTSTGPLLLDFGAARRVIGDMTHALTVVLKPGYAPIEQYGDVASMSQGAWTDLYALACVIYYAVTGHPPPSSVERLMDDRIVPLATRAAGRYTPGFLAAVDAALALKPQGRPQDVEQFRVMLDADRPAETGSPEPAATTPGGRTAPGAIARTHHVPYTTIPGTLTPHLPAEEGMRPASQVPAPSPVPAGAPELTPSADGLRDEPLARTAHAESPQRRTSPRKIVLISGGVVAAAALLAALWWSIDKPVHSVQPTRTGPSTVAAPETAVPSVIAPAEEVPGIVPLVKPDTPATTSAPVVDTSAPPSAAAVSSPVPATPTNPPDTRTGTGTETGADARRPTHPVVITSPRSRPGAAEREPRSATPQATPPRAADTRTRAAANRCSDILQKGSLEPLTTEEGAYLRRECR